MRTGLIGLALGGLLVLSACDAGAPGADHWDSASVERSEMGFSASSPPPPAPAPPPPPPPPPPSGSGSADAVPDAPAAQYIAYSYDYRLEFPPNTAQPVMQTHRDRCLAAGFEVCQVMSSSASVQGDDRSQASLNIRALPTWMDAFRASLEGEVEDAGGEIRSSNMGATDLTRPILDAEARLTAKYSLRQRLTALLDRETASVEELVRLERELARVQGDIESSESILRNMRARVSMSTAHLNYSTRYTPTGGGALDPIGDAVDGSVRAFSYGLGDVITFIAGGAPWLILILPALWLFLRWRRRVGARKLAARETLKTE
jgi:hypothetical protein